MSSDFRQIAYSHGVRPKADGLFRAAVSAFSSLTRPSRREVIQLEDLAEPLYPAVSAEAKRFAAAALSESRYAPAELIRRLADEAVDIGAPLLIRSPVLTDVDLIAFIGRHGVPHARAIRRRPELNPAIVRLVDVILDAAPKAGVETALQRLRAVMQPGWDDPAPSGDNDPTRPGAARRAYATMLATVFKPNAALFQTALADALGIGFDRAGLIAGAAHYSELMLAFRALNLTEEEAFLLVAAIHPTAFGDRTAVFLFLERYRQTAADQAAAKLQSWRDAGTTPGPRPFAAEPAASRRIRAS